MAEEEGEVVKRKKEPDRLPPEDVDVEKWKPVVLKCQSWIIRRKYVQLRSAYPSFKKLKERMNLVKELVKTEETFVKNMIILNDFYVKPVRDSIDLPHETPLLSEEELKTVFQTNVLGQILKLNSNLLESLQREYSNWPIFERVTKVVLDISPYLRLYTPFYINSGTGTELLRKKMKESQRLAEFLEGQRSKTNKLDVFDYLIMPVQRIPRYVLFFKGMLKQTNENTKIHEDLKKSLTLLQSITQHVNLEKRYANVLRQTSKRFHVFDEIMLPHRKFHFSEEKARIRAFRRGELYVKGAYDLQLYNDLLLWYNASSKKLIGTLYLVFCEYKSIDPNTFELSICNYQKTKGNETKEVNIRYEFRINDIMDKRNFEKVIESKIVESRDRVKSKGVVDPPAIIPIRTRIFREMIKTDRKCQEQKEIVNQVYERLQVVNEKVEKDEVENIRRMKDAKEREQKKKEEKRKGGGKKKKDSQSKKSKSGQSDLERKPTRKKFGKFLGGFFGKGKKGKSKKGGAGKGKDDDDEQNKHMTEEEKVQVEEVKWKKKMNDTLKRKDLLEIELKREYEKKKKYEEHQKDLRYKLKTCQRQLAICMGDFRFLKLFPEPMVEEDVRRLEGAKKDMKFYTMLIPIAKNDDVVQDLRFVISKCWPSPDDDDFDDEEVISQYDYEELQNIEFSYDKGKKSADNEEEEEEGEVDDNHKNYNVGIL